MNQRAQQAAGLVREAVQKVISSHLHDPRVRGLVTVTRVTISDDLKSATVYVSVMPEQHRDLTMHGLRAAAKHIRRRISDELALRSIPELTFKSDAAAARQAQVLDALALVAREREAREQELQPGAEQAPDKTDPHDGATA
ncbi:MAG: 30S ribosome-binding factor RbfA [Phycisphaerales bacterium]